MVEEKQTFDLFELMGGGSLNEEVVQIIKDNLLLKYNESFEVTHLGRRYGTGEEDLSVTAFCHPTNNPSLIFTANLKIDKVTFQEDYILRKINYELEEKIKELFHEEKEDSIVRSVIIKKYQYEKDVGVEEFIQKEPQTNFLLHIYLEGSKKEKIKKVFTKIQETYPNIKLRGILYVVEKNALEELKELFSWLPSSEDYTIDSNKIKETIRIEEVL